MTEPVKSSDCPKRKFWTKALKVNERSKIFATVRYYTDQLPQVALEAKQELKNTYSPQEFWVVWFSPEYESSQNINYERFPIDKIENLVNLKNLFSCQH